MEIVIPSLVIKHIIWIQGLVKRKTQFTSKCPANDIVTKIEAAAAPMGFDVKKNNYKVGFQLNIHHPRAVEIVFIH